MLSRTHAASAAAVAGLALHIFKPSPVVSVFMTAGTIVGSILPDIDTTSSKISRTCLTAQCTSILLEDFAGHRGLMHTPFFIALTGLAGLGVILRNLGSNLSIILSILIIPFLAGMSIHLLLDAFTPMGIMLLYPFDKKRYSFKRTVKTGSMMEYRLFAIFFLSALVLFCTFRGR